MFCFSFYCARGLLNQSEKISECIGLLERRVGSGVSWNNEFNRFNTEKEQATADKKIIKDRKSEWNNFFNSVKEGTITLDTESRYPESYTCGFAGSNFFIQSIKVDDRNAVIIHKTISQVSGSPCTYNTQVLIPKDDENFYQIGFTYNFGEFKNDCKGFSALYPDPPTPFSDVTSSEWKTLKMAIDNKQYLDEGKFKNFFNNKRIIDVIISTIKI